MEQHTLYDQKGFSLLEVLLALSLFAIVLMGVGKCLVQIAWLYKQAEQYTEQGMAYINNKKNNENSNNHETATK
jgi:prepilin-type N-terminal cleavage/methylation domain-containing protein